MEPDRWRKIEDLFQAALDCERERRSGFLEAACSGEPSLREEIESLLASYEKGGFTAWPAFEDAVRLLEKSHSLAGRRIGPYRVIREIGRGGMGAVYLAARADEAFRKQVAIKLIKRGFEDESIVQRFHAERQILASLDHPNISRLLDGGATEDGSPYFVMEFIEGEPIDSFCIARRLNTVARLRLFLSVCAAVHYAHQHLVIHRDIKPGNVLVTAEGIPRLLDFGIAKLLGSDLSLQAAGDALTVGRLMTPPYASPEQVRGEPVTTASDVYSLGVLLYELLTGHRPYRLASALPADLERAICQEEPEKPSSAIARLEETLTPQSVSATREGTPERLCRRLRGDLDNILLTALRKEPSRRYGSVEQFSEDIRRHLDGLPVIARPNTVGYRAAKLVARHKAGVAAAALILVTLVAGIVATRWEARVAAAERDRARIETAKAERINTFLQEMLSPSRPWWGPLDPARDQGMPEVVERAARRAETELADQPEVLADVQRTIGEVYDSLGRWDQAEPLLRAALESFTRHYGPDHRETARASRSLANVLLREGKTAEAEALFRKAVDTYRREVQRGHPDFYDLARALGGLGATLSYKGDSQAGAACLREVLQYAPRLTGQSRLVIAGAAYELGLALYRSGDLREAERLLRTAVEEFRILSGGRYRVGYSLSTLGLLLLKTGRAAEAEPLIRQGLALDRESFGNEGFPTAVSLAHLADLFYAKGDYHGAEDAARESLAIFSRTLPKGNSAAAIPLTELGLILNRTGRSRQGERHLREALDIRTRLLPAGNQYIGISKGALGECLTTQRRYAEAEPLLLESYTILQSSLGEHDPRTAEAARRLVRLYELCGKCTQAGRYRSSRATRASP